MNKWHYQKCRDCPKEILTRQYKGRYVLCPECRKKVHKLSDIVRYEQMRKDKVELDSYQVISDPDEIGGFRKGAGISTTELEIMLRVDSCGFTPGTVIQKKTGEIFEVILGKNEGLRLKAI